MDEGSLTDGEESTDSLVEEVQDSFGDDDLIIKKDTVEEASNEEQIIHSADSNIEEENNEISNVNENESSPPLLDRVWQRIFNKSEKDMAWLKLEYPLGGWKKWYPLILEQVHQTLYVFMWLFVLEGLVLEGLESLYAGGNEARRERWMYPTLSGRRGFWDEEACFPSMFDELFENFIEATISVGFYFIAQAYGNAIQCIYLYEEHGIVIQYVSPSYGIRKLDFSHGVAWAYPRKIGINFRKYALWIAVRRFAIIRESGHWDDKLRFSLSPDSAAVCPETSAATDNHITLRTVSYSAFPEWFLIDCGSEEKQQKVIQLLNSMEKKYGGVQSKFYGVCSCIPAWLCVQPCQRRTRFLSAIATRVWNILRRGRYLLVDEQNIISNGTDDFENQKTEEEQIILREWRGTLFTLWYRPLVFFFLAFIFLMVGSMIKPNSTTRHQFWGKKPSTSPPCGEENTFEAWLTAAIILAIIISLIGLFFIRGKWRVHVSCTDEFLLLRAKRSITMVRWDDVLSYQAIGLCQCTLYRWGSGVLKIRRFERVQFDDTTRDGCCGVCGLGTCWDMGIGAGVYFLSGHLEHTSQQAGGNEHVYLEVPHLTTHFEELISQIPSLAKFIKTA